MNGRIKERLRREERNLMKVQPMRKSFAFETKRKISVVDVLSASEEEEREREEEKKKRD